MSSFNVSDYISYILSNNENMSSGKGPTLLKTTLLPGRNGVTVVASLPTKQSRDVTANIPKVHYWLVTWQMTSRNVKCPDVNDEHRLTVDSVSVIKQLFQGYLGNSQNIVSR